MNTETKMFDAWHFFFENIKAEVVKSISYSNMTTEIRVECAKMATQLAASMQFDRTPEEVALGHTINKLQTRLARKKRKSVAQHHAIRRFNQPGTLM